MQDIPWGFDKYLQTDPLCLLHQATSFLLVASFLSSRLQGLVWYKGKWRGCKVKASAPWHRGNLLWFTYPPKMKITTLLRNLSHCNRPARKFFSRSDLNLSSCGWNWLCPGWSSVEAAGERALCVQGHNTALRPWKGRWGLTHGYSLVELSSSRETARVQ